MGLASVISQMFICGPVITDKATNEWVCYLLYLR